MPSRRSAAVLAALSLAAAAPVAQAPAQPAAHVVAAKSCPSGYPHAVMPDGSHKCLHAGEYCKRKHSWQRAYHRHGFHCKRSNHRLRER
jgi:hypothetical protein